MVDEAYWELLAMFERDLGINLFEDPGQTIWSEEIVAAEEAFPFEGGMLALTPLRSLVIEYSADTKPSDPTDPRPWAHSHGPVITRFLTRHLGSADVEVGIQDADGAEWRPVREIPDRAWPIRIFVPASDEFGSAARDPRAMQRITARLRRPDGCPWDRKQTHESLAKNFVDEVYEVVDAIESGDPASIAEELGDLFLLIMMQAQIGHEAGTFSIEDVYAGIARKIVGRHPHVFGEAVVETDADLSGVWAAAKEREQKEGRKHGGKDVDGEPFSMPALTRATRILAKSPVADNDNTPEFLRIVGEIVARGEDPDAILKQQLRDYVSQGMT